MRSHNLNKLNNSQSRQRKYSLN